VFWELGEERPTDRVNAASTGALNRVRKQAWVTAQALETGPPGVVLRHGQRAVGYALFAPSRALPQRGGGVPAMSGDALVLATAWLDPEARAAGYGRLLVQAAVKDALRLDLKAVEAYGDRRSREWDCVLPAAWLLHEGFEVAAEHPRYPLLRIDTKRVARWAESLEHAVEELLGRAARPRTAPQPTTATVGAPTGPA
jgi:GNAT superfamily N-acetyltransferase